MTRILIAEHARTASLFYAVLSLALDGCGVEGELLCRPMFEALVTATWTHNHPDEAAERFLLHERYLWYLYARARNERGVDDDDPELPRLSSDELQRAEKQFGRFGQRPWTGHSVAELADEYVSGFASEANARGSSPTIGRLFTRSSTGACIARRFQVAVCANRSMARMIV